MRHFPGGITLGLTAKQRKQKTEGGLSPEVGVNTDLVDMPEPADGEPRKERRSREEDR